MCGIIGYLGDSKAASVVIEGLKSMEYRGYDSVGVAISGRNLGITIVKDVGRVGGIEKDVLSVGASGNIGIGHTRWATHGGVTKDNSHPHISNSGKIAVIHNGILENHQILRELLEGNGFKFSSETDTEVIPNLIEFEMSKGKGFERATMDAVKQFEGYYAIIAIKEGEEKMIAAKNGSPLVVGMGEKEYFIASDIPAFLKHTKNVVYIQDGDFISIDKNGVKIIDKDGHASERPLQTIDWDLEKAKKGNFDHFMMKEISEQVETIKSAANQSKDAIMDIANEIRGAEGVFLVACGSSYHACLSASYLFSKIAKKHVNVVLGSEFSNYEHFLTPKTLVIAVSQSGETIDVIDAIRTAKSKGSRIVSLVNVIGSSLHRMSDKCVMLNAGPEICVLSTKTYTAQLTVLSLLAYALGNRYDEGKGKVEYVWNTMYNLTAASTRDYIKRLAEKLKDKEHLFIIGRGLQFPTSLEAALKIKEVSYIHAEGFSGGELKHGTIALVDKDTPCVVFCSKDNKKETLSNATEIKSRGGYIIGIDSENNDVFDFFIKVPDMGDFNPIAQIIPIQILSYQLALLKGCDPDRPRNLAKSVTVK